MSLQKHLLLLLTFLFSTVFSIAQLHSEPVRSVVSDSTKVNYLSPNQILITDSIINYGKLFLNTPYRHGSGGTSSFDCSGFTSYVYRNFGYNLSRSSADQAKEFDTVQRCNLKTGDLVFFSGRHRSKRVGHVGIVVSANEDGKFNFIHASVHEGVIISNSDEPYYLKRFIKAGRVINSDQLLAVARCPSIPDNTLAEPILSNISAPVQNPVKQIEKTIPAEYHRVKKGETLSTIARKFGMTLAQLKRKNNLHGNKINPKQRLKVKDEETILVVEAVQTPVNSQLQETENQLQAQAQSVNIDHKNTDNKTNAAHTVKKGETLFSISKLYNTSVAKLKELNKTIAAKLHPGQQLKINTTVEPEKNTDIAKADNFQKPANALTPATTTPKAESTPKSITHKIIAGESLYTIAKMYNVSVDDLMKDNNLNSSKIKPGMELKLVQNLPAEKLVSQTTEIKSEKKQLTQKDETQVIASTHKVRSGESLYTIAKMYDVSVQDLKKANNMTSSKIKPGQKIKLIQNHVAETVTVKTDETNSEKKTLKKKEETLARTITHKVVTGESLFTIAKMYNVSVDDLKKANGLTSSKIKPDMELKLVQSQSNDIAATKQVEKKSEKKQSEKDNIRKVLTHRVKRGENLITIAKENNTSVEELKRINQLSDSKIHFGQKLKLNESTETQNITPAKTESAPKIIHHKVKSGESFYSIAKVYNCKMDELKEWNKKSGSKIKVGERIIIYQKAN